MLARNLIAASVGAVALLGCDYSSGPADPFDALQGVWETDAIVVTATEGNVEYGEEWRLEFFGTQWESETRYYERVDRTSWELRLIKRGAGDATIDMDAYLSLYYGGVSLERTFAYFLPERDRLILNPARIFSSAGTTLDAGVYKDIGYSAELKDNVLYQTRRYFADGTGWLAEEIGGRTDTLAFDYRFENENRYLLHTFEDGAEVRERFTLVDRRLYVYEPAVELVLYQLP
jgi:hypothetical protein